MHLKWLQLLFFAQLVYGQMTDLVYASPPEMNAMFSLRAYPTQPCTETETPVTIVPDQGLSPSRILNRQDLLSMLSPGRPFGKLLPLSICISVRCTNAVEGHSRQYEYKYRP